MGPDTLPHHLPQIDVVIHVPTDARGIVFLGEFGELDDPDHIRRRDVPKYWKDVAFDVPREPVRYPDFPWLRDRRILIVQPVDLIPYLTGPRNTTNVNDYMAVGSTNVGYLRRLPREETLMYDPESKFQLMVGDVLAQVEKLIEEKKRESGKPTTTP